MSPEGMTVKGGVAQAAGKGEGGGRGKDQGVEGLGQYRGGVSRGSD